MKSNLVYIVQFFQARNIPDSATIKLLNNELIPNTIRDFLYVPVTEEFTDEMLRVIKLFEEKYFTNV